MERGFFVLEDRVYADATFGRDPGPSVRGLAPGRMIYVNSLSKVVGGGLRTGWVAARGPVRERIAMLKLESDFHSATLIQHIAARWLATGAYDKHVGSPSPSTASAATRSWRRSSYARRIRGRFAPGGHHIWVTLTRPLDDPRALYTEAARGVAIIPGDALTAERHTQTSFELVLAARPARARRGRRTPGSRDPRAAPPLTARRGRADVLELLPHPPKRSQLVAGEAAPGTACGLRPGGSCARSRTARRPSA